MQSHQAQKFYTFLQVLRVQGVDLWEFKIDKYTLVYSGDAAVLYSHLLDEMVLKVNETAWYLDKGLQVIGTLSIDHGWQTYTLPVPGGHFVLRFNIDPRYGLDNPLVNFETILQNKCEFVRNNQLLSRLDNLKEQKHSGLEGIIHNVVENITKNFTTIENEKHPNQILQRSFKELLDVESDSVPVFDISEADLKTYKTETELIVREQQGLDSWTGLWQGGINQSQAPGGDLLNLDNASTGQNLQQNQGVQGQGSQQQNQGPDQSSQIYQGQESTLREASQQYQGQQTRSESAGEVKPGDEGYHDHQQAPPGKHHHDQQEVLGGEGQRLPAYEVHETSEHIEKGFEKAASNVFEGEETSKKLSEDTQFTTGLLKGDIDINIPVASSDKNSEPKTDSTERKDLPKEALSMQEPWGSNISNPSETNRNVAPPTFPDSDFGRAVEGKANLGNSKGLQEMKNSQNVSNEDVSKSTKNDTKNSKASENRTAEVKDIENVQETNTV